MRPKILTIVAVFSCLAVFDLHAGYLVSGSNGTGLSASSSFSVVNDGSANPLLQITLTNTSMTGVVSSNHPLTTLFLNEKGNPSSATLPADSGILSLDGSGDCGASSLSDCFGDGLKGKVADDNGLHDAPFAISYGISAAGPGLLASDDMSGAILPAIGGTYFAAKPALIQNSVIITLALPEFTKFNLDNIGAVPYEYTSGISGADFQLLPEPSSYFAVMLLLLAPLVALRVRRSQVNKAS